VTGTTNGRTKDEVAAIEPVRVPARELQQAQQRLAAVVERAKAKGFGAAQQGSPSKTPTATRYVAESAQAAGFLR
jgi:hypothetical protein